MSPMKTAFCASVASLSLAACSTTDNWDPAQRNAAIGGAAGVAVADDDLSGALIGGAPGAHVGKAPP